MPDGVVERDGHARIVTVNRFERLDALSGALAFARARTHEFEGR